MCKNRPQSSINVKWLLEHQIAVNGAGVIDWLRKEMDVTHEVVDTHATNEREEHVIFFFGSDRKWYVLKLSLEPVCGTFPRQISAWDLFIHYNQR